MATATVSIRRWTREEYERLVEQGFFHPEEKIELVDGVIFGKTPQTRAHTTSVLLTEGVLRPLFAKGFDIRVQMPLALGFDSEPEPDLAVVSGGPMDYLDAHPSTAVLVVEVAEISLLHDRKKAGLYARAGIPEYWLVNLTDGCLEVYRAPKKGAYSSRAVLSTGDSISPLSHPEAVIPVEGLLPRK